MALPTLLDIAKLNGSDIVVGLIEENLTYAPELNFFPVRTISGTQYDTTVRIGFPSVGFRAANAGFAASKSTFDRRRTECLIFGGTIQVDKAVGQAYDQGLAAYEMIETSGVVKNSMIKLGAQIWEGVSSDASGFPGLRAALPKGGLTVKDATGTTASTASSVYGIKFGIQDIILPMGKEGVLTLTDFRDQQITNDSGVTWLPGRVADMTSWIGLQVGNANCAGRILNLTADSGKGLTDTLMESWLSQFPVGYLPDMIFMNRTSFAQLQASRTVTLFAGPGRVGGSVGNLPAFGLRRDGSGVTTAGGIPIVVTDSIPKTGAIE